MNLLRIGTAVFAISAVSACASTPAVESAPQSSDATPASVAGDAPVSWRGTLQATQQRTGNAVPTSQHKSTGTISLTQTSPGRTRVRLVVSTPIASSTALQWAIAPGRCGSGNMAIAVVSSFPVVEISNNGRGELDMTMQLDLPTSGSFHANVFSGGTQLNNVITCANLARG